VYHAATKRSDCGIYDDVVKCINKSINESTDESFTSMPGTSSHRTTGQRKKQSKADRHRETQEYSEILRSNNQISIHFVHCIIDLVSTEINVTRGKVLA